MGKQGLNGRVPDGTGLSQAGPEDGSGPTGFDPSRVDWVEEGRKHFLSTKLHPERLAANYPTQDICTPKAEADFILGFTAAKGEWEAGKGLSGIAAYAAERDENTRDRDAARSAETACPARVPQDQQARADRHRPNDSANQFHRRGE